MMPVKGDPLFMVRRIGSAAMYEQAAEEASEFAHAALKCARILRDENPTPVTFDEALSNAVEEKTDLELCCTQLGLFTDCDIYKAKAERFMKRWKEAHPDDDLSSE